MRTIIFFMLFSVTAFAQENLTVENGKIQWQKIYETDLSESEIREIVAKDAILSSISEKLTGESKPVDLDCESRQAIYMRNNMVFFATIDVKEGRYRVTVSNIRFNSSTTLDFGSVETTSEPENWETYQLKNRDGSFRGNKMAQNSRECIDNYLQDLFKFEKKEDNW